MKNSCLVFLFIFIFFSCLQKNDKNKDNVSSPDYFRNLKDTVILSITPTTYNSDTKRIIAILYNNTSDTLYYGRTLWPEYQDKGQWRYYNEAVLNNDILAFLYPNRIDTLYIFLFPELEPLAIGEHRTYLTLRTNTDTIQLCAKFHISND